MCRLLAVKSTEPVQLADLITRPIHSIINQASDSRLRLAGGNLNADGFGLGWYDGYTPETERNTPCIFQAITPAWSNRNLHRLAEKIKSKLVFAHVRASTLGVVSEPNCHPWAYGVLMFMHNGEVAQFAKIKRKLQSFLEDRFYNLPLGSTDSEWCFALLLQHLSLLTDVDADSFKYRTLQQAVLNTIASLNKWAEEAGTHEPSLLNFCVTDGHSIIATRYISSATDEAASLWFSTGSSFEQYSPGGHYRMRKNDKRENIVLVASEPLTFEKADWLEIPCQTCVVVTPKMNVLQIPIHDQFFQDTIRPLRDQGFASSKGYQFPKPIESKAAAPPLTASTVMPSSATLPAATPLQTTVV